MMPTKQPSRDHYVKDGRLIWPSALETEGKTPGDEQRLWYGYTPSKYYNVHLAFIYTRGEPIDKPSVPRAATRAATPEDRQRWKDSGLYEGGVTEYAVKEWVDWNKFNNLERDRHAPRRGWGDAGYHGGNTATTLSFGGYNLTRECLISYGRLPGSESRRGYDRILGRYENPPSQLFEEFRKTLTDAEGGFVQEEGSAVPPAHWSQGTPAAANKLLDIPDNYDQLPQGEKDKITGPKADPLLPEFLKQQEPFKREQMMVMLNKDMPGNSDIMYSVFKHLMGILSPDETLARVKAEAAAEAVAETTVETAAAYEPWTIGSYLPGARSVYDWLGRGNKGGGGRRYRKKRRTNKRRTKKRTKRRTKKRRTKRRTKKR